MFSIRAVLKIIFNSSGTTGTKIKNVESQAVLQTVRYRTSTLLVFRNLKYYQVFRRGSECGHLF
jgi:hypothetical protein